MDFALRPHTVLLTIGGSRAYGLHHVGSDVDVKGVAVPPVRYLHGFAHRFEQADRPEDLVPFLDVLTADERLAVAHTRLEGSVYDLRKFFLLATDCNPNILDVLFCRDEDVRVITPVGRKLRAERDAFLSMRARHSYGGYAAAQLKRIRGHRAWLVSPPAAPPKRADFGLPEHTLLPSDQLAAAQAAVRQKISGWDLDLTALDETAAETLRERITEWLAEVAVAVGVHDEDLSWLAAARLVGLDENLVYVLQRERAYEASARAWRQYETWRTNRNPERAALEARTGYDAKHAGHLVRLLRMASEILRTGKVHVWRGPSEDGPADADEIHHVRTGAWSYDELLAWVREQEAELDRIVRSGSVAIPSEVDRDRLDGLCAEWVAEAMTPG